MLRSLFRKIKFLIRLELRSSGSFVVIDKNTEITLKKNSKIIINKGVFKIGGALPGCIEMPSYHKTQITMDENSSLIIEGDVNIASGTFIHIKKNASLRISGGNFIGHNNIIICSKEISIGSNSSTSWNVTLIDHDGHTLFFNDGTALKKPIRPLKIEDNVGLQMNVTIPSGVTIGKNALIGANTTIREDIPSDTLVYNLPELRKKNGISAGLQFIS